MARESKSGWSRPWAAFFALIIILGGVAISLGFGVRLRGALERNAESRMATASTSVQTAVTNELGRYADAVRLSAAAMAALPAPTAAAFDKIAEAVDEQDLTAVRALTFVAPDSPGLTASWRSRGATGFTPRTATGLQEHFYTVFAHTLGEEKTAPAIGVDQGSAQAVVDAARLATGHVAISDAYVRLADAAIPKAQQQLSFDVLAPVAGYGWVSMTVGAADFVSANLTKAAGDLLDAQVMTRSSAGALAEVATVARGDGSGFRRTQNFTAGERQWVLRTSATYKSLLPNAGRTDMVVVIAGSTLAVMFGTLMYLQMSATARAEREIAAEVGERLRKVDAESEQGRLRGALAAQEALLSGLIAHPGEETTEVDLRAVVAEVVASGLATAEVTVGDLPQVRADGAILHHLLDTMLADALSRTPPETSPTIAISAGTSADGLVRLVVESAGTVIGCTLPSATVEVPAGS
ncbi:hypothetical protein GCM10010435_05450 [Winogradskya consettensis]|uniref:Uncharacterized protein n=1 Tax=Winogradskya consettensis TaxID=113560 RepID=A0A919SY33_9ACTN|nr:CHASE domain-containing protein [Actinoplanes consettensis]GIM79521.1 hypothetical protein Aco04nite_65920 [Actinoplanes consettensis]